MSSLIDYSSMSSSVRNRDEESGSESGSQRRLRFGQLRLAAPADLSHLSRKRRRRVVDFLRRLDARLGQPLMDDVTDYTREGNFLDLVASCADNYPHEFDDRCCSLSRGTVERILAHVRPSPVASLASPAARDRAPSPTVNNNNNNNNVTPHESQPATPAQNNADVLDVGNGQPRSTASPSSAQTVRASLGVIGANAGKNPAQLEKSRRLRRLRANDDDDGSSSGASSSSTSSSSSSCSSSSSSSYSSNSSSSDTDHDWWSDGDKLAGERMLSLADQSIIPKSVMKSLRKAYRAEGATRFRASSGDMKLSDATKAILDEIKGAKGCTPPQLGAFLERLNGVDKAREREWYERSSDILAVRTMQDAAHEVTRMYGVRGHELSQKLLDAADELMQYTILQANAVRMSLCLKKGAARAALTAPENALSRSKGALGALKAAEEAAKLMDKLAGGGGGDGAPRQAQRLGRRRRDRRRNAPRIQRRVGGQGNNNNNNNDDDNDNGGGRGGGGAGDGARKQAQPRRPRGGKAK